MKKVFTIILAIMFCFSLIGCKSDNTQSTVFSQEVTIVKMPSPPKCKTSDDISDVNKIIDILGLIEKSPAASEKVNGWQYMIIINVDGQKLNYTISSGVFTDSDGKQYRIENFEKIEEKIMELYNEISAPETDYQ